MQGRASLHYYLVDVAVKNFCTAVYFSNFFDSLPLGDRQHYVGAVPVRVSPTGLLLYILRTC